MRWCRTGRAGVISSRCSARPTPAFRTTSRPHTRRWRPHRRRCWTRSTRNAWASRRAGSRRGAAFCRTARAASRPLAETGRRIAARSDRRNVRSFEPAATDARTATGAGRHRSRSADAVDAEARGGRERAPKAFQRFGAQRVRGVRAQVVLPVRVRGHRRPGLVGVRIRHGLSSRARRFSRRVSAPARERRAARCAGASPST